MHRTGLALLLKTLALLLESWVIHPGLNQNANGTMLRGNFMPMLQNIIDMSALNTDISGQNVQMSKILIFDISPWPAQPRSHFS
jgi:hypothetical protein